MIGLSNEQKKLICMAARRAYAAWEGRLGFEAANPELSRTACFGAWRHCEIGKVLGILRQSLRECTQADYARVLAHFQQNTGESGQVLASQTLARDSDNPRRIARYKLNQALRERGLAEAYAAAICMRQYRCALDHASAGQLWRLVYTVRNRRKPVLATANQPPSGNPF